MIGPAPIESGSLSIDLISPLKFTFKIKNFLKIKINHRLDKKYF